MDLKRIRTEAEYNTYLAELQNLVIANPDNYTPEFERMELLALIVGDYENRNFHISYPDSIDAIKFCMEQQGLKQKDLVDCIGTPGRVSEILNRKRALTLPMIRKLNKKLGIPTNILVQITTIGIIDLSSRYVKIESPLTKRKNHVRNQAACF